MAGLTQAKLLDALRAVKDPESGTDIVARGMVHSVQISPDGDVVIPIEVDPARGAVLEALRQQVEKTASAVPGVTKALAVLTAQREAVPAGKAAIPDPHGVMKQPRLAPPVRHIIAVASGKGGVGKSTVAANLAVSFARMGLGTGLLDADIYGPSQPRMMGLSAPGRAAPKPEQRAGKIVPLVAHGVKTMSIGFMIDDEKPLIWRGPMVQSALIQLIRDVEWAPPGGMLDVLVVDLPPGTGDVQLTMAQKVPVTGAVIVSTPQDIALLDARKAVEMFRKVDVPILGLIENMSTHICSNCGHEDHIFGHGGAQKEARALGIAFLGAIPLSRAIRENGDQGMATPQVFEAIAQRLHADSLSDIPRVR